MKHLRTYHLAVRFVRDCKTIQIPCHLKNQFERAASSIALNLAEGSGRATAKDQARLYVIAMGSIREVQAIVDIYPESFTAAQIDLLDHLAASNHKLIKATA